jgi:hypothetical protein
MNAVRAILRFYDTAAGRTPLQCASGPRFHRLLIANTYPPFVVDRITL